MALCVNVSVQNWSNVAETDMNTTLPFCNGKIAGLVSNTAYRSFSLQNLIMAVTLENDSSTVLSGISGKRYLQSNRLSKLMLKFSVIKVKDGTYNVKDDHVVMEFTVVRLGEDLVEEDIPVVLNPSDRPPSVGEVENAETTVVFVEGKTPYPSFAIQVMRLNTSSLIHCLFINICCVWQLNHLKGYRPSRAISYCTNDFQSPYSSCSQIHHQVFLVTYITCDY